MLNYIFMSYSFQLFSICFLSSCGEKNSTALRTIHHSRVVFYECIVSSLFLEQMRVEPDETQFLIFCKLVCHLAEQDFSRSYGCLKYRSSQKH